MNFSSDPISLIYLTRPALLPDPRWICDVYNTKFFIIEWIWILANLTGTRSVVIHDSMLMKGA